MNLILIGYRGTGKSVVARILEEKLGMETISMDARIVEKAGMSIPEIVEKYGWNRFREMETEVAKELAGRENIIIDTGGGVIERLENIEALKADGAIFWLKASPKVIESRIQTSVDRPALIEGKTFLEEIEEVLERRTSKYKASAHHEIDTDEISTKEVADLILEIFLKL